MPLIPFALYDKMIAIGKQAKFDITQPGDETQMHAVTSVLSSAHAKSLLTIILWYRLRMRAEGKVDVGAELVESKTLTTMSS